MAWVIDSDQVLILQNKWDTLETGIIESRPHPEKKNLGWLCLVMTVWEQLDGLCYDVIKRQKKL